MRPELRTLAGRLIDQEQVMLHVGPGILRETPLPAESLAQAVWGAPEGRFTAERFQADPEAVWADWLAFWHERDVTPADATPLPVHEQIADLVDDGIVSTVLTENVFGQLARAGVPDDALIELHGRADRARCEFCDRSYDAAVGGTVGHRGCAACAGTLGPGIVLAGETPDRRKRIRATARAADCDLYLAVETSLTVDPTAELPAHAVQTGGELVLLGTPPADVDGQATRLDGDGSHLLARLADAVAILR